MNTYLNTGYNAYRAVEPALKGFSVGVALGILNTRPHLIARISAAAVSPATLLNLIPDSAVGICQSGLMTAALLTHNSERLIQIQKIFQAFLVFVGAAYGIYKGDRGYSVGLCVSMGLLFAVNALLKPQFFKRDKQIFEKIRDIRWKILIAFTALKVCETAISIRKWKVQGMNAQDGSELVLTIVLAAASSIAWNANSIIAADAAQRRAQN